jgi:hypothetical protein
MKHSFLLRIRKQVFDIARSEAKARGISINDYLTMCIEVAMAEFMNETADAFIDMVKDKAIQRERKRLRNE